MLENHLPSIDDLESALLAHEAEIGRQRAAQLELLRALDSAQVAHIDGCRTMIEWTASRLDVTADSARDLVRAARRLADHPALTDQLHAGETSLDRAVATATLADAGADDDLVNASRGYDLAGVYRLAARCRRMTRADERAVQRERFVAMQPTLDRSAWRLWGMLGGYEGAVVEKALNDRGDEFPDFPDGRRLTRGQRSADALVAISQDSLDGTARGGSSPTQPLATVFVDATLAAPTRGESGAEMAAGPRIGPDTLDLILCDGMVEITAVDAEGRPGAVGSAARAIPPRVRRYVLWRDGGCAADGCTSRYRLQPHHIRHRAGGGSDDPINLVTLCWFHHHIVIHRYGYRIDPNSPPRRLRFLRPEPARGPP